MLEEQLGRDLINKGAEVSIWSLEFNEKFNFKGSIGPFKADFSETDDKKALVTAVCEGEGDEHEGKDAFKLLKKIHQARISGVISNYALMFSMEPHGDCDVFPLFFTDEGLRVDYTKSHWENNLKSICEKPCPHQDKCPSYQAHKAGKEIIYSQK